MSGYDFIVDTGKLEDLITGLDSYYQTLEEDVSELKSFFGEGDVDAKWSGEAYNSLKSKYDTSAKSYDVALAYLKAYKDILSKIEDSASTLCSDIVSVCDLG